MNFTPTGLVIFGLVFALIGVVNLTTARLHPDRPNSGMSRGLGYIGVVVGSLSIVFGLLQTTGILKPPPEPPQPVAAPIPAPAPTKP